MTNEKEHFDRWYKRPLESLYVDEHAGFAILILSFPLAERYLRQKSRMFAPTQLGEPFYRELLNLFPGLADTNFARQFWGQYRHGLLHQATVQLFKANEVCIKNDLASPVHIEPPGTKFTVSPVRFARKIVDAIELDFETFVGAGTKTPPLSSVAITAGTSGVSRID
jgi:hypothetical protein